MKRCNFCGYPNNEENQFCVSCGRQFESEINILKNSNENKETENTVYQPLPKKETNSLATVSFILTLISFGCIIMPIGLPFAIVISLFSISTGIIALIRKPKISKGKTLFGIIGGSIALILCIVIFIVAGPLIELLKDYLKQFCKVYSNSDECIMIEEMLPNLLK